MLTNHQEMATALDPRQKAGWAKETVTVIGASRGQRRLEER
jgi:hypothetical protein